MCTGLHAKPPLFLSFFNQTWIFEKPSNIKFNKNTSSGNHAVPHGQTDEKKHMMKVIAVFRNFSKTSKTQGTKYQVLRHAVPGHTRHPESMHCSYPRFYSKRSVTALSPGKDKIQNCIYCLKHFEEHGPKCFFKSLWLFS